MPHHNFEKIVQEAIRSDPNFSEILEIVKSNTQGKTWVVGGFIFRNIAASLYGTAAVIKDYDFVVEQLINLDNLPPGWRIVINTFGGSKIQKSDLNMGI